MTANPGAGGTRAGLVDAFGEARVLDFPFAEAAIAGIANGAAMAGMRPVVDLGNLGFSLTAMDQIANEGPKARFASGGQLSAPIVYCSTTRRGPRRRPCRRRD